jgi:hypothetical protein
MNKAPRVVEDPAPPGTLQSLKIRAHHEFLPVDSPPQFRQSDSEKTRGHENVPQIFDGSASLANAFDFSAGTSVTIYANPLTRNREGSPALPRVQNLTNGLTPVEYGAIMSNKQGLAA